MSAETIPAEVATDLDCIRWYVECLDAVAFKRRAVAGLAEAEGSYNAAMKRLADRSTRPAEPAAPAAEAGDGEVVAWEARFAEAVEIAQDKFAWKAPLEVVELQSDLLALLRDYASTLEAERARADAAEQRAADALARAEKAAEDERDRLYTKAQASNTAEFLIRHGATLPADRARLRALREAQPASDPASSTADRQRLMEALRAADSGFAAMIRLSEMGLEESLREPEESGNFASFEQAKRFLATVRAALATEATR